MELPGLDADWPSVLQDQAALQEWHLAVADATLTALVAGSSVETWMKAFAPIRAAQVESAWQLTMPRELYARVALIKMGSAARGEDLLGSDIDHAVLAADPEACTQVVPHLYRFIRVMSDCLCPPCEGFVMATNPRWIGTVTDWRARINEYISFPNWENARYLFMLVDSATGEGASEWQDVVSTVRNEIRTSRFLCWEMAHLGIHRTVGLRPFRRLALEQVGETSVFSVKERMIAPIIHAVRLLSLTVGVAGLSTRERCMSLAEAGVLTHATAADVLAAVSFGWSLRLRGNAAAVLAGSPLRDWVDFGQLNRAEQSELRMHVHTAKVLEHLVYRRFPKPR